MNPINRVPSGIPGLDSLIQGGLIKGNVYLVTGSTGTGKTIFCCQFLHEGLKRGETAVYITLEEDPEDIKGDAAQFGWDFPTFEKKGLLTLRFHDPAEVNNIGSIILNEIQTLKASRLVIDSTSIMAMNLEKQSQIRRRLIGLINSLKNYNGCTTLLVSEIPEESKKLSRYGVEEFVVDGILLLNYLGIGETTNRSIIIRKMRRTNHGKDVYPLSIGPKGITVKKSEI